VVRSSFWSTFVVMRFMVWYRIQPSLVGSGVEYVKWSIGE
jgi:hypothetical protein